jgi:putative addiction module component (TIGR02574 family)
LLESLDETEDEDAEDAWDDEIKRRVDEIRSGRVKTVPGEQVSGRLEARRSGAVVTTGRWFDKLDEFSKEPFQSAGREQPMLKGSAPQQSRSGR